MKREQTCMTVNRLRPLPLLTPARENIYSNYWLHG